MFRRLILLIPAFATCAGAAELRVATLNVGALIEYDPSYKVIYGIGPAGQPDHDTVAAVLSRIDADVVALQEISSSEIHTHLAALATGLGYPHRHVASNSGSLDNSLMPVILSRHPFLETRSIVSPGSARELSRNHPLVRVGVPGAGDEPWIVAAHLKSGTTPADRFRRAVEMRRLVEGVETQVTGGNFVILGDFNPSGSNTAFNSLPADLPQSYSLGADIGFPVAYFVEPLAYFGAPKPVRLDARDLAGSPVTRPQGSSVLDIILISPALASRPVFPEIYQSSLDADNLSGRPKSGAPLNDNTSELASDHLAVFADLNLAPFAAYALDYPGQTVTEDFGGLLGMVAPQPWKTGGGPAWNGRDDGTAAAPGFRAYGPADDPALGFLPYLTDGSAVAAFVNRSGRPLTALDISYTAEQWRAALNGLASRIEADLIVNGVATPLPGLTHVADAGLPTGTLATPVSTVKTARANGLRIPPGGTWELRFRFLQGGPGGSLPADVFINEFHYDNAGTDEGEFVEVVVGPGHAGDLSEIILHFYNGGNGQTYGLSGSHSHALDTFEAGEGGPGEPRYYWKHFPGIQNGAPDGFALSVNGVVTGFISYEGSFTATNGPAAGMQSVDVGVFQNGSDPLGEASVGLTGRGNGHGDFRWTRFSGLPHSPGFSNNGQDFTPQPQGLAVDDLAVTFLQDSDGDGQIDDEEELFGTDPLDPASFYQVTLARPDAAALRMHVPTMPGRDYTVQWSETLSGWQDLGVFEGTGGVIVIDLDTAAAAQRRFYRVKVDRP